MLYELHELNRSLLNPMMQWAEASSRLFSDPTSPFSQTPFAHPIAAGYELLHRLGKHYDKPPFGIEAIAINGKTVAIVEEVTTEKLFCILRHFKKILPAKKGCTKAAHSFIGRTLIWPSRHPAPRYRN